MLRNYGLGSCLVMGLSLFLWGCAAPEEEVQVSESYPEPVYPSYLKVPETIEEILPYAQAAVRQTGGRTPLGLAEPGKRVAIFTGGRSLIDPNPLVLEAIIQAYQEVGVEVTIIVPEPEGNTVRMGRGYTSEDGFMEVADWIGGPFGFLDPEPAYQWMQEQEPELYRKMYPEKPRERMTFELNPESIQRLREHSNIRFRAGSDREYLDQHGDQFDIVYTRYGGRGGTIKDLGPHGGKFYGNFIFDDYHELNSKVPSFPGDLWRLVEERIIEPLAWADRAHVTDPEGTDLIFDVTEQEAKDWAESTYYPGHLFLYPHQGTTRLPSVVYPTLTRWIAAFVPEANGVVAGTRNHTGVFPRVEVQVEKGKVTEIRGGGDYGAGWRALLNWPKLQQLQYPYYEDIGDGFFFLYECALGTNPKFFTRFDQAMQGRWMTEREAAGVVHWGFGVEVRADKPGEEGRFEKWRSANDAPRGHYFHIHNMFITFKVRIRGTDRWLTLVDKGRIQALDNPEVRLLASRYGDPDEILRAEWVPSIPGINAPGDYEKDYANDPWKHITKVMKEVEDGTYAYFGP